MLEQKVIVQLQTGLHARPAALFVQEAGKFSSDIFVSKGDKRVNGKSIIGMMSLAIAKGSEITLIAEGTDETEALQALRKIVSQSN
jgi:catabolite repression HPr-like protein